MITIDTSSAPILFVVDRDGDTVSRRPLEPGAFVAGVWTATDVSGEPQEVQDACAAAWTTEAVNAWKAAHPWVEPPTVTLENISKNIIWERMTHDEAAQADAALKAQPPKIQRIYEGATYVSTRAAEYPLLLNAMTQLFGKERASEILRPNF